MVQVAPWARIMSIFFGLVPSFTNISHLIPARAQYAATELPALPLESCTTLSTPMVLQWVTSTAAPRSLKESVGIR